MTEGGRDLSNTDLLVIGGSSGIGLETVIEGRQRGYRQVFATTTNLDNFNKAKAVVEKRRKISLGTEDGVTPVVMDVRSIGLVALGVWTMEKKGVGEAERLDVVYSQAGGMEGFSQELYRKYLDPIMVHTYSTPIEELAAGPRAEVDELLGRMNEDLKVWAEEALPNAREVNYEGTLKVHGELEHVFPDLKKRGVFINSTWGHLSGKPGVEIPKLYGPVDKSKALVRDWLADEQPDVDELVASLVRKTKVGKMFEDVFFNLMDADQRKAVKDSSINPEDVTWGIWGLLDDAPKMGSRVRYVYRRGGAAVVSNLLETSEMYTKPYRF